MSFKNGKTINIAIMSVMHLLVDATGAAVVFNCLSSSYSIANGILIYMLFAFGTQPFLGILADKTEKYKLLIYISVLLMISGLPITLLAPYAGFIVLGLGNSLFHVSAGGVAINTAEKNWNLGVYVSGGAVGLALGINLYTIYWLFPILLFLGAIILQLIKFNDAQYKKSAADPERSDNKELKVIIPMMLSILFAVYIRGLCGFEIHLSIIDTKSLSILFACCVAAGKFAGGFIADKIGISLTVALNLIPAAFLLYFGYNFYACLFIGIFLFNTSMPLTLRLLIDEFSENRNFAFGLTACILFLGSYSAYYLPIADTYIFIALILLSSAAVIFVDLKYKNTMKYTIKEI